MTIGNPEGGPPASIRVIEAISEAEGVDPVELDQPLNDVIDLDAVDAFFSDRADGTERPPRKLVFEYQGYRVTVTEEEVTVGR